MIENSRANRHQVRAPAVPAGSDPAIALNILVSAWSATSSTAHEPDRVASPRWEDILDTSGPLYGLLPTSDATSTATARYALLRLLEHIGDCIMQLSDLLETLSPNRPTADELARTATVFDTRMRVLAARRDALTQQRRDG